MKLLLTLTLLVCFGIDMLNAQEVFYRKTYQEAWTSRMVYNDSLNPNFLIDGAVILYSKNAWHLNKVQNTTTFNKQMAIQFLSEEAIKKHAVVNIPEAVDSLNDYSDIPLARRSTIYRPKLYDLIINYFHARIKKANGNVIMPLPTDSIQTEAIVFNDQKRLAYSYHILFDNIEVGDILEVEYQFYLPYVLEWQRIFFHQTLPIQTYVLELHSPARNRLMLYEFNGAAITDTTLNTDFNNTKVYTWQLQNLAGSMNEIGNCPHKDLPHIYYYMHNKIYGHWHNDKIVSFDPYSWRYYGFDLIDYRRDNIFKTKKLVSREELALNNFFEEHKKALGSKDTLKLLRYIHKEINSNFKYLKKNDYYANNDERLKKYPVWYREKILTRFNSHHVFYGVFNHISETPHTQFLTQGSNILSQARPEQVHKSLKNKYLQNINRWTIYKGILNRLRADYYLVLLTDNRIGRLRPDICLPVLGENRMLAAHLRNKTYYILPKRARGGYFINELPFYLQDEAVLHIWQMTDDINNRNIVRLHKTPSTKAEDNVRQTNVAATINEDLTINFDVQINLSGQYSTLLRHYYAYGQRDSSINPIYYKNISHIKAQPVVTKPPKVDVDNVYPYKATVNAAYFTDKLVQKTDSTLVIPLADLIAHVIHDRLSAEFSRTTPYYFDFVSTDTYNYYFTFPNKITLANYPNLPIVIKNDYLSLRFDISQPDVQSVLLQSKLQTHATKVPTNAMASVYNIYNLIKSYNNLAIIVKNND